MCITVPPKDITFKQYIKSLPSWQQTLISQFKENTKVDPLITFIQLKQPIIVTFDGSKSKKNPAEPGSFQIIQVFL